MSRLAKKPIILPAGVELTVTDRTVRVKGPKGALEKKFPGGISIERRGEAVALGLVSSRSKKTGALWGLSAALMHNMIEGVTRGFEKQLEISGIGFRAEASGKNLRLSVGFTHPVEFEIPESLAVKVEKNLITISGTDKELVGEMTARIRAVKPPEPYKGKGIRYVGEVVRRKAGKAVKAAAA